MISSMKLIRRIYNFFRYNSNKRLCIITIFISLYYSIYIKIVPMDKAKKRFGIAGKESPNNDTAQNILLGMRLSHVVDAVCSKVPWECKCLVRALTIRCLLKHKKIESTMYLGVKRIDGKLDAHAWVRCGEFYLSGGNGEGYAVVGKFL